MSFLCITSHDKVYTPHRPHVISHQITWHHMTSHQITWPHIRSHDITWLHIRSHDITWLHIRSHDLTWPHIRSHDITPSLNFHTSCTCTSCSWIWSGAVFWVPNMSADVSFLPPAYETVELDQWLLPGERYPLWRGGDWGRKENRADWPRDRFAALYIIISFSLMFQIKGNLDSG